MKNKPTSWLRWVGLGLLVAILAGVAVGGGWLAFSWEKPLGPALDLPTRPPGSMLRPGVPTPASPASDPAATDAASLSNDPAATPAVGQPAATVAPAPGSAASLPAQNQVVTTAAPLCGGPPDMVILAIAADAEVDDYLYGLADAIRVVRIDFVTPRVAVFSLPRDLWVDIPGIAEHYNITQGKLNQAYFYGNPGMGYYSGPGAGPGLLARTLVENFDLYVDHYGALNMRTFVDVVDALGGVDVYLETAVDGRDEELGDYGFYPAGWNHLDGQQALNFSRVRNVGGTTGRNNRQTQVLLALREKALQPQVVAQIPDFIQAFIGRVQTDLTPQQVQQLACLFTRLDGEKIEFDTIPGSLLTEGRIYSEQLKGNTYILKGDFTEIGDYIHAFLYPPVP